MVTEKEINDFVVAVNVMLAEHTERRGFHWETFVEAEFLKKRIRIVKRERWNGLVTDGKSAYCFVDMETGDILKAAGWATPAKGIRGNIKNGAADLTPYGAVYLK